MQEPLIEQKELICDQCGRPSKDHTYHQVPVIDKATGQDWCDMYLCTECYKWIKALDND